MLNYTIILKITKVPLFGRNSHCVLGPAVYMRPVRSQTGMKYNCLNNVYMAAFESKLVGNINPETRHSMPRSGLSMLEQRLSPPFEESNPTWRGREYGENSDLKIQEIPSEMPNNFKIFLRTPLGNSRVETNLVPRVLSPLMLKRILEFPTHYFNFHLLTTSVNAKYYC